MFTIVCVSLLAVCLRNLNTHPVALTRLYSFLLLKDDEFTCILMENLKHYT